MESETIAALIGAVVGSAFGGLISWLLQRSAFKKDREDREREKRDSERALLFQVALEAARAVSDLQKWAEIAGQARLTASGMNFPKVPGLTNLWSALNYPATLSEPISIRLEAITVFIEKRDAELAMGMLDMVAVHRSAIRLWEVFKESRRALAEKFAVKFDGDLTYTTLSANETSRHYPHLKEVTDLAEAICDNMYRHHAQSSALLKRLEAFIMTETGVSLTFASPGDEGYIIPE